MMVWTKHQRPKAHKLNAVRGSKKGVVALGVIGRWLKEKLSDRPAIPIREFDNEEILAAFIEQRFGKREMMRQFGNTMG